MVSFTSVSIVLFLSAMMFVCVKLRKLTPTAALTAGLVGASVFLGTGLAGLLLLFVFFILSVLATAHKKALKAGISDRPNDSQTRSAAQVIANGGVAALLGILAFIDPLTILNPSLYKVMMAGSLASALADTLSSELGMVYGKNFFNILSFKKERNGLDGVISVEGTVIGALGSLIIAILSSGWSGMTLLVFFAGISGNMFDSILGATLERRGYIGNNLVNFLNTLFAASLTTVYILVFFVK